MSHQPFEQWILDDRSLSADETKLLAKHAENCVDCSKLQEQWKNAAQFLKKAPMYPAPEGFTARWQTSFMARKALQQKQNGKKFIFFLVLGSFSSLLMYLTLTFLTGSPIKVFITFLKASSKLMIGISQINLFLTFDPLLSSARITNYSVDTPFLQFGPHAFSVGTDILALFN